jgi:cytochrome oxidase Cu insertion factor (SCO1/SenC/PrrC family)
MNTGLSPDDPTLVAAFRSALWHQGAIGLVIVAFLYLLWATARTLRSGDPKTRTAEPGGAGPGAEAAARRLLRIGFGMLWIFDGILQAQPKMASGLAAQVIEPTATSSPGWVQHVVNWGGTIWSYHPIQAGAASVWIQAGIGLWLIVSSDGSWSRLAGLASVAWGLIVWVFGESFGGIFAPGLSWLTGAPGAVLVYMVAGALIALPEGAWRGAGQGGPRLGRLLLAGLGVFLIGMAVLQAWPGRGFWQGRVHGDLGTLSGMVNTMSGTSQPHFLSSMLSGFASFVTGNAFAVNLFAVIALAGLGVVFLSGRERLVRYGLWFAVALCLADWVLVQDLGFFGGLGTDPNSMIPMLLLFTAGYLALRPAPAPAPVLAPAPVPAREETAAAQAPRPSLTPRAVGGMLAGASGRTVAAVAALAVVGLGAAPMASATVNRTADPILALAIEGSSTPMDIPAPGFALTDQNGRPVSLASLRGKVVLMTFLDPVCTTDCPIIGQEFRQAGAMLGSRSNVELVAIVANPTYRSTAFTQAFDRQEGLDTVPNWLFLTGSLSQLSPIWRQYGVTVQNLPAGAMSAHNDLAVIIDRSGHIREELGDDPGPGTASTKSSFAALLSQYARQAM